MNCRGGGNADAKALVRKWSHEVHIAIMRRRAAMMRALRPRAGWRDVWLFTGRTDAVPSSGGRMPLLKDKQGGDFVSGDRGAA